MNGPRETLQDMGVTQDQIDDHLGDCDKAAIESAPHNPLTLSPAQRRILLGLRNGGGVLDRYGRVIAKGEIIAHESGLKTILWLIVREYVYGEGGRLFLTMTGNHAASVLAATPAE